MNKTKIVSLSYNAMFKAIFSNNNFMLSLLIQSVLDYCNLSINVMNKELIVKNNELSLNNVHDKQLICDYLIKINEDMDLNIEVNRAHYPGLEERNLCYCFKIYCDHFKAGDDYDKFKKYLLVQVNFNNFSNPDNELVKSFYLLDIAKPKDFLTKNICILNIDIASCEIKFYNKDKLKEMSILEKFGAILKAEYLEDISNVLRSMRNMSKKEKDKFLKQVVDMSKDKDIQDAVKLEDNIEYRFDLVREDALERGAANKTIDIIKEMLKKNIDIPTISSITGKSIEEIEKMASKEEIETNNMKLEDNIEYRFDLVREDALERGITQGIEQNKIDIVKEMLKNNIEISVISNVTGKSINEIKEIEKSIKE